LQKINKQTGGMLGEHITVSESYRSYVKGGLRCANVISAILRFRLVSLGKRRRQNACIFSLMAVVIGVKTS